MKRTAIRWLPRSSLMLMCAVAVLSVIAPHVDAQRRVRGVAYDSLRTQAPLAGVEVALLGANMRAGTASLGRFEFTSVPEGAQAVAHWAPWLDSLGLPPLRASLDGAMIVLATPSRATFERALCGAALEDGQGVLVGEVRGSDGMPQGSVLVLGEWHETAITRGAITRQAVATVDTTDASGNYALCGVPVGTTVTLQAASATRSTGTLLVPITAFQQRLDLIVGSVQSRMRVLGRVVEQVADSATPIAGAVVSVVGDSATSARTDASGGFELQLPWRSTQLDVRAIGYRVGEVAVSPVEDAVDLGMIVIGRVPPQLDPISVTADAYARERQEFEFRRTRGLGHFVTDEQLKKLPTISSAAIHSFVPSTQVVGRGLYLALMIRSGSGMCSPRFFEDGLDVGVLQSPEQHALFRRAKRVEVYAAAEAPARFNDFGGCGAVVVWTR